MCCNRMHAEQKLFVLILDDGALIQVNSKIYKSFFKLLVQILVSCEFFVSSLSLGLYDPTSNSVYSLENAPPFDVKVVRNMNKLVTLGG